MYVNQGWRVPLYRNQLNNQTFKRSTCIDDQSGMEGVREARPGAPFHKRPTYVYPSKKIFYCNIAYVFNCSTCLDDQSGMEGVREARVGAPRQKDQKDRKIFYCNIGVCVLLQYMFR